MSLKRFLRFYSSSKYTLECRLSGHNDAILCLAVSNSGKTLASGGCNGLRLWDLEKKVELRKPNQTWNPQDPITCIVWLTPKDDNKELLCGGTGLGYLFLWKKRGHEFEETLARRIGMRVFTATRDKHVQVWTLDSRYNLSSVFSVELLTTVPRAIYSYGADVVVFGMYNGEIHTLHGKDGVLLATKSTGRLMGGVAVDQTRTFFVINNAANGFSLHRMDDAVALAEEATVVVGGGENGSVYVFDRATRQAIQTLQHSKGGRVQTVATHSIGCFHLILAATSSNEMETWISVWRKEARAQAKHETQGEMRLLSVVRQVLQTVAQLVTMVMVALLVVQMMHQTQYTETSHQSLDIARES
ncbi:WD40-repeat-containing domain protein [Pisolithus croceorrhizus]|nr:WD40-repeat-containing domain protein [Pisolithus croceorrhizus]